MEKIQANTVTDAISKIHEFEKFGSILGLERMTELLEKLGNPQDDLKVIHVAGTNGKGSVCRYLYSVLQENGYRTGIYTSPFLEVFNERIELDGEYISDEDLAVYTDRVLEQVSVMVEQGKQSPTEFEVITAIAFLYFKEKKADYVILEVGLGGRGDSTNVCKTPLATVITSISYDHTDRLGNTLTEIAGEKAGIIKDSCPVITSAKADEALAVIQKIAAEHEAMYFETRNLPVKVKEESLKGTTFDVIIQGVTFDNLEISMVGGHQVENALAALTALCLMEERGSVNIEKEALYRGMKKAKQIGRFELLAGDTEQQTSSTMPASAHMKKNTPIILDGAHNPDGAAALAKTMARLCPDKKILMVVGMLADKDVDNILKSFTSIATDFIVTEPDNPRKMQGEELAKKLRHLGFCAVIAKDRQEACDLALEKREDYDLVLFAGSLYLIGEMRSILRRRLG